MEEIKECVGHRPSWDEYFMLTAIACSTRATCHHVKAGCVIVLDKRIIGTGYNGAPPGITNCLEAGCRKEKLGLNYKDSLNTGTCVGVHAEMNALANLSRLAHKGASVYITIFPCHSCAKTLLAYNISRIVYKRAYDESEFEKTKKLFEEAGVVVEKLDLSPERITKLLFDNPNVDFDVFSKQEKQKKLDESIKEVNISKDGISN